MDKLSLELLQLIMTLLSQRQLATCSLVCRSWYTATRIPLYRSIQFYTIDQVNSFLQFSLSSSMMTVTTPLLENMMMFSKGYLVRRITFYMRINDHSRWQIIQQQCPYVESIDVIPENNQRGYGICCHRSRHPLVAQWKHLTRLPVWHSDSYQLWKEYLPQLIHLGMDMNFYEELLQYTTTIATKILCLPFMPCLQELDLYASNHFFHIDEHTLEAIHHACPSLRSLSLTSFQLHYNNNNNNSNNTNDSIMKENVYEPALYMTKLRLILVSIHHVECYSYLGLKYPGLTTLEIEELCIGNGSSSPSLYNETEEEHRKALFQWITCSLTQLVDLRVELHEQLDDQLQPPACSLWPYLQWQKWYSLDHLTSLTMTVLDSWDRLDQLSLFTTSSSLSSSMKRAVLPLLTTLSLKLQTSDDAVCFSQRPRTWSVDAILATCPSLTHLFLSGGFSFNHQHQATSLPYHGLKELMISHCVVSMEDDLVALTRYCPQLQSLSLHDIRCLLKNKIDLLTMEGNIPLQNAGLLFHLTLNINLSLDYLGLTYLWYECQRTPSRHYTKRVIVDQIKVEDNHHNSLVQQQDYLNATKVCIHIKCQFVDHLHIQQNKSSHQ
ncbi:uncharacterized protein BX664DRAFT_387201 [Halteromyces radiatus]|uniref:uncharacterized protein n=1 Tax=Halteromyces radiatus TaxID=101107 RepID=UPI0022204EF8|nr:uncharacterized protein BX664DRAFT_387201 [Halteromyces radiatus]KAI8084465.1 hypothetical protein BX664DRAFT_387201 [Halteromyces radiatus]